MIPSLYLWNIKGGYSAYRVFLDLKHSFCYYAPYRSSEHFSFIFHHGNQNIQSKRQRSRHDCSTRSYFWIALECRPCLSGCQFSAFVSSRSNSSHKDSRRGARRRQETLATKRFGQSPSRLHSLSDLGRWRRHTWSSQGQKL